ncbi:MAG TPA: mandelate racemase/muconate lactonizing enzyme family protein [Pseudomonadales bacterium]|nr:mandelate racemase/muconate lactonizing enzyme family protein [Pseudomonadales bacterium]
MKLSGCTTYVVANPPPHFGGRYFIFVKLATDDGIEGIGEAYVATFGPHRVAELIEDVFERHLLGRDPAHIEAFYRRAWGSGFTARPDVTLMGVVSALEMACWDIVGKALDRPLHMLLGGRVRERVRSYTYLYPEAGDATDVYADPDLAAERAAAYVARGFTAVKFDPAGPYTVHDGHQPRRADLTRSARFMARLREAVGDRADLLFGTHGQFTSSGALRVARAIEPFDPLWLEEPVPPDDERGMARVAAGTSIPVAAGERLTTKSEFMRLLDAGVTVLQPNLGRCGGVLEARKIAALAEARGAQIAPHVYCGPVVAAASLQLALSLPNFLIMEGIGDWGGFHAALLKTPIRWQDGFVLPPDGAGLGVELDEEVARAHPYEDDARHQPLHLSMQEAPIDLLDD